MKLSKMTLTIEGERGSGKTTVLRAIRETLKGQVGIYVGAHHLPGGTAEVLDIVYERPDPIGVSK